MKKILLPVDGSESDKAYEMAKSLAKVYGSTVYILHVDEPITPIYWANETLTIETPSMPHTENGEAIVNDVAMQFEGISHEKLCRFGDASSVIIEVSEEEDVDLIIMCTHGMSAIKRFLLGSVTNKVVHHATKPVLVIR
ncbi:MAG: universal stress protein [Clostridia bacterium]|nr:universal stress protein [Clostridia bacterium]